MSAVQSTLDSLGTDGISKLSLGGITVLIFTACAGFSLLRGLFRMLIGTATLCAAGYTGYVVWGHFPSFAGLPWLSYAVPIAAGLVVFIFLTKVVGFFSKPFSGAGEGAGERTLVQKIGRLAFSLVPASALWFSGATALRHFGSVAEVGAFADSANQTKPTDRMTFLAEAKGLIDKYLPAGAFQKIDPLSDTARVKLAKLIAAGDSGTPLKAIPVLEEPEIRNLILNDPQLRELARERRYGDILRDPRLDHVIDNPDLKRLLAGLSL
jgi:hypothetical protein